VTPLIAAFQFLTIIPTLIKRPFTSQEMGRAVGWFPLVGLALGGVLFALSTLTQKIFSNEITAVLIIITWVMLTRAFHLDGLMDTADGIFGGFSRERRLEIMQDSRVGAFGVVVGILILLLKYATLISVNTRDLGLALVISTTLGRWALPLVIVAFPYARKKGLGYAMKENAGISQIILATIIAASAVWMLSGAKGLLVMGIVGLIAIGLSFYFMRHLKGLTGDNYGAITELVEALVLLVFAIQK
jgi:adenosylcobinamide-GDP ribazoletransferase